MSNSPRIAALQMCSSHIVEENLHNAAQLISLAAQNKSQLIVLPEMFAMMGKKPIDKVHARYEIRASLPVKQHQQIRPVP